MLLSSLSIFINRQTRIFQLENVVGFEQSWEHHGSFQTFRQVLSNRNYHVVHIHLDPTHVGIPNNRPRHYTVAIQRRRREEEKGRSGRYDHLFCKEILDQAPIIYDESSLLVKTSSCTKLSSFLDKDIPPHISSPNCKVSQQKYQSLQIPIKIQNSSSAWCFDIATINDNDECITSCFTHSYGKFIRGTGSILYTGPTSSSKGSGDEDGGDNTVQFKLLPPEERTYDESWSKGINWDYMRYFSGTEVARLMGFPVDDNEESDDGDKKKKCQTEEEKEGYRKFSFPSEVTMKQQWKLLGNSLNVRVAAAVAEMGIDSVYS